MVTDRPLVVELVLGAIDNLAHAMDGLEKDKAEERLAGCNSIAWIVAHATQHLDSWVNCALAAQPRNSYFACSDFSTGATGIGAEWDSVCREFSIVQDKARVFLAGVSVTELANGQQYRGSHPAFAGRFVTGNDRLARVSAHIYLHVGEITTMRVARGS